MSKFVILKDMSKDWTKIQEKYEGLWVALAQDEETVLAAAKTAREALSEANKQGHKDPILTRMPEKSLTFVG